ncbi:hypothetical protein BO78DRAFT_324751, partial [Aspergillus sclerotiicarbonarius CBS 121057]
PRPSNLTPEMYRIPPTNRTQFTKMKDIIKYIEQKHEDFEKDHVSQYIEISGIKATDITALETNRHNLPSFRSTFFETEERLILKLTDEAHESLSRFIFKLIDRRLEDWNLTVREIRPHGAGKKLMVDGNGSRVYKAPDESWSPATRDRNDFPSIVVEVGFRDSYTRLKNDAGMWVEMSEERTRIVLLVVFDQKEMEIVIERWERRAVRCRCGIDMRSGSVGMRERVYRAECIQRITLTYTGPGMATVIGAPLVLPLGSIFDGSAGLPLPDNVDVDNELSFSEHVLEQMAIRYFEAF